MSAVLFGMSFLVIAFPATAETYHLREHPGWQAWGSPESKLTYLRADRSLADMSIVAYPASDTLIASEGEARAQIAEVVAGVAKNYPSRCAALPDLDPTPNGMGFEIVGDEDEPPCRLFVSLTPEKRLFANLWIDNGDLPRDSFAYQKIATLWFSLAVKRIQGDPIVPDISEPADLQAIAERVSRDHGPLEMLHMHQTNYPPSHAALAVFEGEPLTNCSNWDPSAYAPRDLRFVGGSGQALFDLGRCAIFAWKQSPEANEIEAFVDGEWRSLQELGKAILYDEVSGARLEPFEPGEMINFLGGDKTRLFDQHRGASLRDLRPQDAWFTPDGRYTSGGFGLENRPAGIPAQSNGRYYLHEHIAVFERDDGPILVALAGKISNNGEIERVFIGDRSFEASPKYEQLLRK